MGIKHYFHTAKLPRDDFHRFGGAFYTGSPKIASFLGRNLTTVYPTSTHGAHGNSGDKTAGKHLFPSRKGRKRLEISGNRYSGFLWDSVEKRRILTG